MYDSLDLGREDEQGFINAVEELPQLLLREPVGIELTITRLQVDLRDEVHMVLSRKDRSIIDRSSDLSELFTDQLGYYSRLIIGCLPFHELAQAAQEECPSAVWGCATGCLALTYRPGIRQIIWHEALHLLGAKDCYDLPDQGPTCGQDNCIMQYEPTDQTVGDWPWLCDENIGRIRSSVDRFNTHS